jgi:virginiamycin B lyase
MHIFIPKRIGRKSRGVLHQLFIAANSAGIQLTVFPHGLRVGAIAALIGNISSSSPNCQPVSNGRACSFEVAIPPGGPYDLVLATFDRTPVSGAIPVGAKQLGAAVASATIVAGEANAIHVAIGGVVAHTYIRLSQPDPFHAIASRTARLDIGALDADGNTIATDTYVDANGNPVTIAPEADSAAGSTITFTPARFSVPQANGVMLQYSAIAATEVQLKKGFITHVSANTGLEATTGEISLAFYGGSIPIFFGTDQGPHDIAVVEGTWFVTNSTFGSFDNIYNDHVGETFISSSANPTGIAVGTNGDVWFAESGLDQLGLAFVNPYGATVFKGAATLSGGAAPVGMTTGPDGAIWFTEQGANAIGRMEDVAGKTRSVTTFPLPTTNAGAQGITAGPDGAVWFTECSAGKIGRVPVNAVPGSSAQIEEFAIPLSGGAFPLSIVTGSDGALWFTDNFSPYIGRITVNGSITRYTIPSGKAAGEIAAGPDGAMWFTEPTGDKIGRITTTATTGNPGIVEFDVLDSAGFPFGITVDTNGSVYYTEFGVHRAVEFQ